MKKGLVVSVIVCVVLVIFYNVFSRLKPQENYECRTYQHEEYRDADSSIGQNYIAEDGTVSESTFVTHLPIVIVDTRGNEVPNIYKTSAEGNRVYRDSNQTEPYVDSIITIINNEDCVNHIYDKAQVVNNGKIKLRGVSSRKFEKKNYGIKLLDDNKEELELPLLGMAADEDWVLSNSILDATLIRNYIASNIGGQIFSFNPETRFCELIMKEGDTYNYKGLYLLSESVKKSKDRVNIADFKENETRLSYLICRDRANETKLTLDTWASTNQICYGYFTVKYPKEEQLTDRVVKRIEDDLTTIEKILYSDDPKEFMKYSQYIDVDTFVDYFVFNEFMMCYDSGNNSTYYYQDVNHKLSMGPLWDYDNCFDNYKLDTGDPEYMAYVEKPWFEQLIKDPVFQKRLVDRYNELRQTILSDEYIEEFIDDTVSFLGNAAKRDRSRWRAVYEENHMLNIMEDGHGYMSDRNRDTYEEEILRLKDVQKMHAQWMDEYMGDFLSEYTDDELTGNEVRTKSYIAAAFVVIFIIMLAVVRQKMYMS